MPPAFSAFLSNFNLGTPTLNTVKQSDKRNGVPIKCTVSKAPSCCTLQHESSDLEMGDPWPSCCFRAKQKKRPGFSRVPSSLKQWELGKTGEAGRENWARKWNVKGMAFLHWASFVPHTISPFPSPFPPRFFSIRHSSKVKITQPPFIDFQHDLDTRYKEE